MWRRIFDVLLGTAAFLLLAGVTIGSIESARRGWLGCRTVWQDLVKTKGGVKTNDGK